MSSDVRRRWSILAKLFKEKQLDRSHLNTNTECSQECNFESYQLMRSETISEDDECCWKKQSIEVSKFTTVALIRHLTGPILFEELIKFNNTGNVCVWPAEEVLAYYILKQKDVFSGKSVIEVGGGMTCMAGVMLALACDAKRMVLTDGSDDSMENVDMIVERNKNNFVAKEVSSRLLRWDHFDKEHADLKGQFDFVLSADCLFFDEFRGDLVHTIAQLLKPEGEAIVIAPKRGHSLDDFVSLCKDSSRFKNYFSEVLMETNFDREVYRQCEYFLKNCSNYSPNRHQPILIKLKRSKMEEVDV